jgi:hypothetical protein
VKDLTGELEPQDPALAVLLAEAVKAAFDQDIELVDFDDNRAIVSKGDEAWVVGYHFDETNSEFLFAQPKQVVLETVVRVVGEEVKGSCECGGTCGGCGGAKTLEADAETKVGRKISSRNVTKIAQVVEVLQSIINEVMPSEGPLERKGPEEKAFIPGKYSEFSDSIPFECASEDEIVDVVEALSGVGVPVRFPTPELFAAGVKTLDVLMPIDNQEEFVIAMGKALSNVESLKE